MTSLTLATKNKLLAAMPVHEYQRLAPHLEPVGTDTGSQFYRYGQALEEVYFPLRCVVSLVAMMEDGRQTEMGLVGNEGIVGAEVYLGAQFSANEAIVQYPSECLKMKASILLAETARGGVLRDLLLRHFYFLYRQVSQTAACNARHNIEQRLCRWLLMVRDRLENDEFRLTQEFISQMLGARREGVTIADRRIAEGRFDKLQPRQDCDPQFEGYAGYSLRMLSGRQGCLRRIVLVA